MRAFRYFQDELCWGSILAYACNRWFWKPHGHAGFMHDHFNDLLLIPAALPLLLSLHRRLGLRAHDLPPTLREVLGHCVVWSVLFEWVGPHFMRGATGDPIDAMVYGVGGLLAWVWWNRGPWLRAVPELER